MIKDVIKDTFEDNDKLCNYGYIYEHCAAFVIMDTYNR